jgi:hypothetical protein
MKARWFGEVYRLKLICILNFVLANFFFITRLCLSKSCKIYLLIVFVEYIRKPFSVGVIKRTNSRKELLLITINIICIYMIYFRSNYLNFSILIREISVLYEVYEALVIIAVIKGAGEKEGVGEEEGVVEEVAILLISLSLSFLRLIRCIFSR